MFMIEVELRSTKYESPDSNCASDDSRCRPRGATERSSRVGYQCRRLHLQYLWLQGMNEWFSYIGSYGNDNNHSSSRRFKLIR